MAHHSTNSSNAMGSSLYTGFEANNLVNFYNSNLLDEMLSKSQGKYTSNGSKAGPSQAATNANKIRKNASSALANPSQSMKPVQNSLLKQQLYAGPNIAMNSKALHSSVSLDVNPMHR